MNKVIFNDGVEIEINSIERLNNIITIKGGNVPQNCTGFRLVREINPNHLLEYPEFTTIYRVTTDSVVFSNDETVYSEDTQISVIWVDRDNYDSIRPESLTVNVKKNNKSLKALNLSDDNEWKHVYTDKVTIPTYTVSVDDVEGYEVTITGTTIILTHIIEEPQLEEEEQQIPDEVVEEKE